MEQRKTEWSEEKPGWGTKKPPWSGEAKEWCAIMHKAQLANANYIRKGCILLTMRSSNKTTGSFVSTIVLAVLLLILSVCSLFVGVTDINIQTLLESPDGMETKIFLLARIPRLLAILCTGIGMSVAGLIMQQLCMNKFVSPSTGATIQSAQFGILLSLVFVPGIGLWGRVLLAFAMAVLGTWVFVWFIQRIQFKNAVLVPLIGIMFGNVLGGITNFMAYKFEVTQQLTTYFVGSFSLIIQGDYELVWLAGPLVIIAFIFATYFNIVGMGKDFSQNLGVNYNLVLFQIGRAHV